MGQEEKKIKHSDGCVMCEGKVSENELSNSGWDVWRKGEWEWVKQLRWTDEMCEEKVSKDVEERGLTRAPRPNRWRRTGRRADKKAHDPGLGVLDPRCQGAKAKASSAVVGQGIFSRCSGAGSRFLKMRFHLGLTLRSTLQALTKTRFYALLPWGAFSNLLSRNGPSPPLLPGESCGLH